MKNFRLASSLRCLTTEHFNFIHGKTLQGTIYYARQTDIDPPLSCTMKTNDIFQSRILLTLTGKEVIALVFYV